MNNFKKNTELINAAELSHAPPQSVSIEKNVLGAILVDQNIMPLISEKLHPGLFYDLKHQLICKSIQQLDSNRTTIDILTVMNQLKKNGELAAAGGPAYLSKISGAITTSVNVEAHVIILSEKFMLRELIKSGMELQQKSYSDDGDVFDIVSDFEKAIMDIMAQNVPNKMQNAYELVSDFMAQQTSEVNHNIGIKTGYRDLDLLTGGFCDSDFIIIGARPSMGKSALALNMVRRISFDQKKKVAFFSLEMSKAQLMLRYYSDITNIPIWKLKERKTSPDEWKAVVDTSVEIRESCLFIDDTAGIKLNDLRSKCVRLKLQNQLDCVFIDYLQLMQLHYPVHSREQEISKISSGLKALAKELNIPVIALSQLSRKVEERGDKSPKLSDLRESGTIEQDADVVMFLMRPEYYGFENYDFDGESFSAKGLAQLEVAKDRNGDIGTLLLNFEKNSAKFSNR